jgi:hypothetical protein
MINLRPILILLFFTATALLTCAQVNDAQMWLSANLEKKMTTALSLHFTEEVRLDENITEAGTMFSEMGFSYRFGKRFRAGAYYRFMQKRRLDDTYEKFHGWYVEGRYRERVKPFVFALRARYQSRYDEPGTSREAAIPRNHLRTRLTIKYDLRGRIEPYVYGETFFCTGGGNAVRPFDQLRLSAGVEYAFNRMHTIDLSYLFRREFNVSNPETGYVIGVGYYLTF